MYYVYCEEKHNDGGDVGAAGCFDSAIFFPPVPSPFSTLAFRSFSLSPFFLFFFPPLFIHPARPTECVSILTRKSATTTTTTTMCTRNQRNEYTRTIPRARIMTLGKVHHPRPCMDPSDSKSPEYAHTAHTYGRCMFARGWLGICISTVNTTRTAHRTAFDRRHHHPLSLLGREG